VRAAHTRIRPYVHHTPVLTNESINRIVGARLCFKCENFQKVGAFKFRGATNVVQSLSDRQARKGVVTHSSGNHAAALALAARTRGVEADIVMPANAPAVKRAAVEGYGGKITLCEPTLAARESTAEQIVGETGALLVHPYNDYGIMAGQGTAALELLKDVRDLDMVLAPVGGGGLLSGTAIVAKGINPKIKVIGCEPENADDAYRSIQAGHIIPVDHPDTIADGLRTSLGDKTFPIISQKVDDIVLVSEKDILAAMKLIFERMKIVIEPSAAVPLGALLGRKLSPDGRKIGIILSGGNIDLTSFFKTLGDRS
jgi:threonine dehydratase